MRTERGPRSRAATQLGPLATNGRELSSNKGVKLQSAPTILPRRGPPSYQREGAKLQQGS